MYPSVILLRLLTLLAASITSEAAWLDEIPEDPAAVDVQGDENLIHVNIANMDVNVLINNSTYPIAVQDYSDGFATIRLDKYDSAPTAIPDDITVGASYSKIDAAVKGHKVALASNRGKKSAHAIAPVSDSADTPVIKTTGAADPTGRLRLTYEDLVEFVSRCDTAGMPEQGRCLVLCGEHWNDLLRDRENFGDQFLSYKNGQVLDVLGFRIYKYLGNPYFHKTTGVKLAWGAIPTSNHHRASFAYHTDMILKKQGFAKEYKSDSANDPEYRTTKIGFRDYFIALPKVAKHIGAIVSA